MFKLAPVPKSPDNEAIRESRDGIYKLDETLRQLDRTTSRYSKWLIGLTFAMLIAVGYQILLTLDVPRRRINQIGNYNVNVACTALRALQRDSKSFPPLDYETQSFFANADLLYLLSKTKQAVLWKVIMDMNIANKMVPFFISSSGGAITRLQAISDLKGQTEKIIQDFRNLGVIENNFECPDIKR